jgi:hypothetical protein
MMRERPSRITSLFMPLAALILATVVPYFRAMLHRESEERTVCLREEVGLALLLLEEVPRDLLLLLL